MVTVAMALALFPLPLLLHIFGGGDLAADAEVIEVHKAASVCGGVIEQPETIAHEMRQGISHREWLADGCPRFVVEAIKEVCFVCACVEVTFDLQKDIVLGQRHGLHFNGSTGFGAHHKQRFFIADRLYPDKSIAFLQRG